MDRARSNSFYFLYFCLNSAYHARLLFAEMYVTPYLPLASANSCTVGRVGCLFKGACLGEISRLPVAKSPLYFPLNLREKFVSFKFVFEKCGEPTEMCSSPGCRGNRVRGERMAREKSSAAGSETLQRVGLLGASLAPYFSTTRFSSLYSSHDRSCVTVCEAEIFLFIFSPPRGKGNHKPNSLAIAVKWHYIFFYTYSHRYSKK